MKLNELRNDNNPRQARKRVGRGIGSGKGKTSGSGVKGQKARSGVSINGFEGGQNPIYRRLPKRGFVNIFTVRYQVINLTRLQEAVDSKALDASKKVGRTELFEAGIINKPHKRVKLLGNGELKAALQLEVDGASATAIAAIEKAGGKVSLPVKEEKAA